ncbi:NB-ARC domain-containing protein [Streptomyces sp. BH104]|uniref:NB-ARC domain-containing protein n=1 Tax=Streptomyces sp. BH104 TaxID=3410407 RepID=UPI003BB4AE20
MVTRGRRAVGNLPAEPTVLVGRRDEQAELRRLLRRSRLVTLTGVGGVGKTRLALRAARDEQLAFRDGAWWVELSPVNQESHVLPYALAEELPLTDQSTRPMLEVVSEYLAGREALLVLDTCEHLVEDCQEVVATLLRELSPDELNRRLDDRYAVLPRVGHLSPPVLRASEWSAGEAG